MVQPVRELPGESGNNNGADYLSIVSEVNKKTETCFENGTELRTVLSPVVQAMCGALESIFATTVGSSSGNCVNSRAPSLRWSCILPKVRCEKTQ